MFARGFVGLQVAFVGKPIDDRADAQEIDFGPGFEMDEEMLCGVLVILGMAEVRTEQATVGLFAEQTKGMNGPFILDPCVARMPRVTIKKLADELRLHADMVAPASETFKHPARRRPDEGR